LDDVELEKGGSIIMILAGEHILKVKAVDRAGNPRVKRVDFTTDYSLVSVPGR
jgi:hypothetical protein